MEKFTQSCLTFVTYCTHFRTIYISLCLTQRNGVVGKIFLEWSPRGYQILHYFKFFIYIYIYICKTYETPGNPMAVQWSGFLTSTAHAPGSIPGQETEILQAVQQIECLPTPKQKQSQCNTTCLPTFLHLGRGFTYLSNPNLLKKRLDCAFLSIGKAKKTISQTCFT